MPEELKKYAKVCWTPGDVQTLRPSWSLEQAEKWLGENARHIQDRMVEEGWEAMESLMLVSEAMEIRQHPKTKEDITLSE